MSTRAQDAFWSLTEKEKQTLRLMVRGHDAKSIARSLDLSVHTINERLRDARRKMQVSSSREAARLLLEAEGGEALPPDPEKLGDTQIGADRNDAARDQAIGRSGRPALFLIGGLLMSIALALVALATLPQGATSTPPAPATAGEAVDPEVVAAARRFLALIDANRWAESYQAFASSFRTLNTLQVWADASERMRATFGPLRSRELLRAEYLPAPPEGYMVVKFRSSFANRAEAEETVSLTQEGDAWKVVGVIVE